MKRSSAATAENPDYRKGAEAPSHTQLSTSLLAEYAESGAVSEVVIVENEDQSYRLEVLLTWREGRSVLTAARGGARRFPRRTG